MKRGKLSRALQRWGETPSSPDFYPLEIQGSTESRPTWFREGGRLSVRGKR